MFRFTCDSLSSRVDHCRPQIPPAETHLSATMAERHQPVGVLHSLLWNDARRKLPGKLK